MNANQTIFPLRLVFWGGLLCVFDLTFSETVTHNERILSGFRFDVLNDFVGMLMITFGVMKICRINFDVSYRRSLRLVLVCCVLNCLTALVWHFVLQPNGFYSFFLNVLGLATLASTVLFCTSMYKLSVEFLLQDAASSWRTTRLLVLALWVIPLGFLYVAGLFALLSGQSFRLDIGIFAIPVVLLMVVPLVHLFVSTSRMRREAETIQQQIAA